MSKIVQTWLDQKKIRCLPWVAQSPDLNPIENLWAEIERRLGGRKYKSEDELFEAIKIAWNSVPVERYQKLIESMPRRCQAVIDARGFATKY